MCSPCIYICIYIYSEKGAVWIIGKWIKSKKKVKVTLVQALMLCTGRTAHRGSRGIALLFHDQRH